LVASIFVLVGLGSFGCSWMLLGPNLISQFLLERHILIQFLWRLVFWWGFFGFDVVLFLFAVVEAIFLEEPPGA
jgi:hypothetical protein